MIEVKVEVKFNASYSPALEDRDCCLEDDASAAPALPPFPDMLYEFKLGLGLGLGE